MVETQLVLSLYMLVAVVVVAPAHCYSHRSSAVVLLLSSQMLAQTVQMVVEVVSAKKSSLDLVSCWKMLLVVETRDVLVTLTLIEALRWHQKPP